MTESNPLAVVITTVESSQDAEILAKAVIEQFLAACVQIDGPIVSHYRWRGEVQRTSEYRLLIKTTNARWPVLKQTLARLHPYEQPQIILLGVQDSSDGYRDWVIDQTS